MTTRRERRAAERIGVPPSGSVESLRARDYQVVDANSTCALGVRRTAGCVVVEAYYGPHDRVSLPLTPRQAARLAARLVVLTSE